MKDSVHLWLIKTWQWLLTPFSTSQDGGSGDHTTYLSSDLLQNESSRNSLHPCCKSFSPQTLWQSPNHNESSWQIPCVENQTLRNRPKELPLISAVRNLPWNFREGSKLVSVWDRCSRYKRHTQGGRVRGSVFSSEVKEKSPSSMSLQISVTKRGWTCRKGRWNWCLLPESLEEWNWSSNTSELDIWNI